MEPLVSIRGLTKGYVEGDRRHVVLDGADLDVGRGEIVALLGRSGSGKSTLLGLVAGIDRPDAGSVRVDGVDVGALDERSRTLFRRDRMGFVFQFFNLLPTLTVAENVRLPLELAGRSAEAASRRVQELLAAVGLDTRGGAFPDRLSGGEQQRVALARALAHEPLLLLADEPTGNLDDETGGRALALLQALVRERGTALLMATHSREAAAIADRVLALDHGRLHRWMPA